MSITACNYREQIAYSDVKANKIVISEAEHARTTLWCLKPGQHIHAHVHAGDHVWVVLEGEGTFLSEGQSGLPVKAGSVVVAAAGISHGIDNNGSGGLVFVSVSAG
ncbi:MAG: cupin domain-containing protein [Desulfuromonadales bacterium]|nr:cupin domain-containing protein [Desulfuromonadales bacterium]